MKIKLIDKGFVKKSVGAGILLIIVAAVTLEATSLIQFYFSQRALKAEAGMRAESELEGTNNEILDIIDQVETAVRNSVWIANWSLDHPDSMKSVAARIVKDNPVIIGSTIATVPGYLDKRPLFSPYVYQEGDKLLYTSLATEEYDYPSQEWFFKPLQLGTGYWSEPYVDTGGAGILMTTYSMPIYDKFGRKAAVITADLSLDWLTEVVGDVKVYPSAFSVLLSRQGEIMVCPADSLVMNRTVFEVASGYGDSTIYQLGRAMLSGESGNRALSLDGKVNQVYYAQIEKTGWSMSIVIPEEEIYKGLKKPLAIVGGLQLLGLLMLILILYAISRNTAKYKALTERKDRIENELRIGHNIQMAMVPKVFPPFPERKDLDISAVIVPAREVGGDLYDFFIRDNKLFFGIGDVSGKGIPASLVMAVTRSLFRSISTHADSPGLILSTMNKSMAAENDSNMFVTFFCGVLDLLTGHLRYCNAGHNAPFFFSNTVSHLPVIPNLPLGIEPSMEFREQEMDLHFDDALFLFTDGVSEAENSRQELFGEDRLRQILSTRRDAQGHLDAVREAIADFVGNAPQSDDITMLFMHFLNFHLKLRNEVSQISELEPFMRALGKVKNLDSEMVTTMNIALEEAVINAIMYAYPKGTQGFVDVVALLHDHSIEFVVSDSGTPFDPTAVPEVDTTKGVEDRPIGGLGIHMVRTIMDSVSYSRTDGKNILTMTKTF